MSIEEAHILKNMHLPLLYYLTFPVFIRVSLQLVSDFADGVLSITVSVVPPLIIRCYIRCNVSRNQSPITRNHCISSIEVVYITNSA